MPACDDLVKYRGYTQDKFCREWMVDIYLRKARDLVVNKIPCEELSGAFTGFL